MSNLYLKKKTFQVKYKFSNLQEQYTSVKIDKKVNFLSNDGMTFFNKKNLDRHFFLLFLIVQIIKCQKISNRNQLFQN